MPIFKIAWRLTFYNRLRYLVVILTLGLTTALAFSNLTFAASLGRTIYQDLTHYQATFWLLPQESTDLFSFPPSIYGENLIPLTKQKSIKSLVAFTSSMTDLQSRSGNFPVIILHPLFLKKRSDFNFPPLLNLIFTHSSRRGLIINEGLARKLKLKPGDNLLLKNKNWPILAIENFSRQPRIFLITPNLSSEQVTKFNYVLIYTETKNQSKLANKLKKIQPQRTQLLTTPELAFIHLKKVFNGTDSSFIQALLIISFLATTAIITLIILNDLIPFLHHYAMFKALGINWLRLALIFVFQNLLFLLPGLFLGLFFNFLIGQTPLKYVFTSWTIPVSVIGGLNLIFLIFSFLSLILPLMKIRKTDPLEIFNY